MYSNDDGSILNSKLFSIITWIWIKTCIQIFYYFIHKYIQLIAIIILQSYSCDVLPFVITWFQIILCYYCFIFLSVTTFVRPYPRMNTILKTWVIFENICAKLKLMNRLIDFFKYYLLFALVKSIVIINSKQYCGGKNTMRKELKENLGINCVRKYCSLSGCRAPGTLDDVEPCVCN